MITERPNAGHGFRNRAKHLALMLLGNYSSQYDDALMNLEVDQSIENPALGVKPSRDSSVQISASASVSSPSDAVNISASVR